MAATYQFGIKEELFLADARTRGTVMDKLSGIGAEEVIVVRRYALRHAGREQMRHLRGRPAFRQVSDDTLWSAGAIEIYDDAAALVSGYANSSLGR